MSLNPKTLPAALALVVVAAAACAAGCRRAEEPPAERRTPVRTARVEAATVVARVLLAGRVVPPPDRDALLAPLVPGRLVAVDVRQGERVRRGEVLARVDGAAFDDALSAADAATRRAASEAEFRQRVAERTRSLFEKGVSSREEAEADETAAVAAESAQAEAASALAEARRRRQWADLVAPFDGIVLRVMRGTGDEVDGSPATPVLELAAPDPAEIAAGATATTLGRIGVGDDAEIRTPDGTGRSFSARVTRAARAVDPATGVGEVRLAIVEDAARAALVLGAAVEVSIAVEIKVGALCVPVAALRRSADGGAEVVLVEDGRSRVRAVRTGLADAQRVEILEGLAAGEEVIVDDPNGLADGTPLETPP